MHHLNGILSKNVTGGKKSVGILLCISCYLSYNSITVSSLANTKILIK